MEEKTIFEGLIEEAKRVKKEHMMENNKNLEEIIRTAIIMYDVIKNELKNR